MGFWRPGKCKATDVRLVVVWGSPLFLLTRGEPSAYNAMLHGVVRLCAEAAMQKVLLLECYSGLCPHAAATLN